jgi:hypothetical protein
MGLRRRYDGDALVCHRMVACTRSIDLHGGCGRSSTFCSVVGVATADDSLTRLDSSHCERLRRSQERSETLRTSHLTRCISDSANSRNDWPPPSRTHHKHNAILFLCTRQYWLSFQLWCWLHLRHPHVHGASLCGHSVCQRHEHVESTRTTTGVRFDRVSVHVTVGDCHRSSSVSVRQKFACQVDSIRSDNSHAPDRETSSCTLRSDEWSGDESISMSVQCRQLLCCIRDAVDEPLSNRPP